MVEVQAAESAGVACGQACRAQEIRRGSLLAVEVKAAEAMAVPHRRWR